ncbi:MAG: homoserine dehydrogenase [Anaerolineales bacterium]|nr:homoserine dehydrogenase [Anaerolineales bacterium]
MKTYRLALLGFGNVGRALAQLLINKAAEVRGIYGADYRITGIAARRLGWLADPAGVDVTAALAGSMAGQPWDQGDLSAWLKASQADVLFENTSMNPQTGQPAISYLRTALEAGVHSVTANKGPVVHAFGELSSLAQAKGKRFLHEAAVMGGTPIFSLFREALPGVQLKRFRGILNSTTNLILSEMEQGLSFEAAVKKAQDLGIAETDPSADVDGWDAAVKVSALATVLMGVPVKPQDVAPTGIRALTGEQVRAARAAGQPFKLICQAEKTADGRVTASVRPTQLPASDPIANVNGPDSIVTFEMDTIYSLTVSEQRPDAITTAYGPFADFLTIVRQGQA